MKKCYRIVLLETSEGINLKKDKTEDTVIRFLFAKNKREAHKRAKEVAKSMTVTGGTIANTEYVVVSVLPYPLEVRPEWIRLTKKEERAITQSMQDIKKGRVERFL